MKIRDLKRASRVTNILLKEGLGYVVHEAGLMNKIPFHKRFHKSQFIPPKEVATKIRNAMEELGGMYVKLGQFLSLRPDLVPPECSAAFKSLQDNVAPLNFTEIQEVINHEAPDVFKKIEKLPVGSASIAQVHKATLKTGEQVVIKVQRPNIRNILEADIDILVYLAKKLKKYIIPYGYNPEDIIDEFKKYTLEELNFLKEARHIDTMHRNFKKSRTIIIPKVYTKYSTRKIIVMQHIKGKKLQEIVEEKSRCNKELVVSRIVDAIITQIFDQDVFHADLHPGNILIQKGNKIAFLDFGITGSLDDRLKKLGITLYIAAVNKDTQGIVDVLIKISKVPDNFNKEEFQTAIHDIVVHWHGTSLNTMTGTHLLHQFFNEAVKRKLQIPLNMMLLGKALLTVEGSCMLLYPDFNFITYAQPRIKKIMTKRYKNMFSKKNILQKSAHLKTYADDFAEGTLTLLDKLQRGTVKIDVHHQHMHDMEVELTKISNRLSYALMISALVITSALVINIGPIYKNYSVFSIIALSFALFLMSTLFVSILREPRGGDKHAAEN